MESKAMSWAAARVGGMALPKAFGFEGGESRAERDSLPQAARRAGAAAPGNALGQGVVVGIGRAAHTGVRPLAAASWCENPRRADWTPRSL